MSRVAMITYALAICIVACPSWAINHYRDNAIIYKEQCDKKVNELKQLTATVVDMQQCQRNAAVLDEKYSRELTSAKAEDGTLRADVTADRKCLWANASHSAAMREATRPTNVDNATGPRLTDTAEWDYFTLRERLMTMQK